MSQYIPNCEPCMYAYKKGCSPQWFGPSDEKTVWELKKDNKNEYHPTQKPVELPRRAIRNSSKPNDIILDMFGGSGSTMIGAEIEGRINYSMELDPQYIDIIVKKNSERHQDWHGSCFYPVKPGGPAESLSCRRPSDAEDCCDSSGSRSMKAPAQSCRKPCSEGAGKRTLYATPPRDFSQRPVRRKARPFTDGPEGA